MDQDNKRYILKKLMQDALGEEERTALNERDAVKTQMFSQWNNAPDAAYIDRADSMRIWHRIRQSIWDNASVKRYLFYKVYSVAESVLLLLSVGGMAYYLGEKDNIPVYVVTSCIQNMQSVSLPDGTVVQLGPGSKLTYPAAFTGKTREIHLDGQAFFDIHKNPHKPFIVHTSEMEVQALGTAFEVFDYDIESKSETVLLNGKVKIGINNSKGDRAEFILSPNEKMVYDQQADSAYVLTVDADKYTSWRKQKIVSFENEKLSMIIPRLEQWYGRKIMCQQDLADKYRFTFKVRDESLERILFMLGESSPLKYQKTSNGNYVLVLK